MAVASVSQNPPGGLSFETYTSGASSPRLEAAAQALVVLWERPLDSRAPLCQRTYQCLKGRGQLSGGAHERVEYVKKQVFASMKREVDTNNRLSEPWIHDFSRQFPVYSPEIKCEILNALGKRVDHEYDWLLVQFFLKFITACGPSPERLREYMQQTVDGKTLEEMASLLREYLAANQGDLNIDEAFAGRELTHWPEAPPEILLAKMSQQVFNKVFEKVAYTGWPFSLLEKMIDSDRFDQIPPATIASALRFASYRDRSVFLTLLNAVRAKGIQLAPAGWDGVFIDSLGGGFLKRKSLNFKPENKVFFDHAFAIIKDRNGPIRMEYLAYIVEFASRMQDRERIDAVIELCNQKRIQKPKDLRSYDLQEALSEVLSQLVLAQDLGSLLEVLKLMRENDLPISTPHWVRLLGLAASTGYGEILATLSRPNGIPVFSLARGDTIALDDVVPYGLHVFKTVVEILKRRTVAISAIEWKYIREVVVPQKVSNQVDQARFLETIEKHSSSTCVIL